MKLHTAAILLLFWLGIFTVHSVKGGVSSQPMPKFRCVNLSTKRLNIQNLVNYERQQAPTDAIMFITAKGIKICVSAKEKWVQNAVNLLDQRRAKRK